MTLHALTCEPLRSPTAPAPATCQTLLIDLPAELLHELLQDAPPSLRATCRCFRDVLDSSCRTLTLLADGQDRRTATHTRPRLQDLTSLLKRLPQLRALDARAHSPASLPFLAACPALESLSLSGAAIQASKLRSPLAALPRLSALHVIHGQKYHAEAVEDLTGLLSLHLNYDIRNWTCHSILTSVTALARLSRLTSLGLVGCSSLTNLSPLSACRSLTKLDLRHSGVRSLLPLAAQCPQLVSLQLGGCEAGFSYYFDAFRDGPHRMSCCDHLAQLDLAVCHFADTALLARCTRLTSLGLRGTAVSDLRPLAACRQLQTLDLGPGLGLDTGVADVTPLSSCAALTSLSITRCRGLSDVRPLVRCTALTSLNLSECASLGDVGFLAAAGQCLTHLDMGGCQGVADIRPLLSCTALATLKLSRCTSLFDLRPLSVLGQSLTHLHLTGCIDVCDIGPLAACTLLSLLHLESTGVTSLLPLVGCTQLQLSGALWV